MKKIFITVMFLAVLLAGGFFYFRYRVFYSRGEVQAPKIFEISKGLGSFDVAEKLEGEGIVAEKIYFFYYLKTRGLSGRIMPGAYRLSGEMSIPEVAHAITTREEKFSRVTFPEGFSAKKMAAVLSSQGLPAEEFLRLANDPGELKKKYAYLSEESVKNLEGYLFPDTYFFKEDISAQNILARLLDNFDEKFTPEMKKRAIEQKRTIREIVIMASLVEREVQSPQDMKIVADIFWKRLENGQRLQSDATLSYFLDDQEDQHKGEDLEIDTPYNSYRYAGLPPGPIGNPGLNALLAALYPERSPYNFFLTVDVDGAKKVIYAGTFEQHVANRKKYGI